MKLKTIFFTALYTLIASTQSLGSNLSQEVLYHCPALNEIHYDAKGEPSSNTTINGLNLHWTGEHLAPIDHDKADNLTRVYIEKTGAFNIYCWYNSKFGEDILIRSSTNLGIQSYGSGWDTQDKDSLYCETSSSDSNCQFKINIK